MQSFGESPPSKLLKWRQRSASSSSIILHSFDYSSWCAVCSYQLIADLESFCFSKFRSSEKKDYENSVHEKNYRLVPTLLSKVIGTLSKWRYESPPHQSLGWLQIQRNRYCAISRGNFHLLSLHESRLRHRRGSSSSPSFERWIGWIGTGRHVYRQVIRTVHSYRSNGSKLLSFHSYLIAR